MKLVDLEPEFLRHEDQTLVTASFADAQSIWFECPVCRNHHVLVSFADRGLADDQGSRNREDKPSRWEISGTGFDDITLKPSVDCKCWHGFVTNGEVTNA